MATGRPPVDPASAGAADTTACPESGTGAAAVAVDADAESAPWLESALERIQRTWLGCVLDGEFRVERLSRVRRTTCFFAAEQLGSGRMVTVEVLQDDLGDFAATHADLARQVRVARYIEHPNLARLHTCGYTPAGKPYLVMEHLDGLTLAEVLRAEPRLEVPRLAPIGMQIAGALQAAHLHGVLHRHLKPENVMLVRDRADAEHVNVLGTATARVFHDAASPNFDTPYHMAPEQLRGHHLDNRVDVFALGVLLHRMATGALPFEATGVFDYIEQVLREPVSPPRQRFPDLGLPPRLETLILSCLASRREDRPPAAGAVQRELELVLREAARA